MDKNSLKDKLTDDHLDLSLCNYSDKHVPVKDIALLKRATFVDLSNNKLTGLPTSFASLTHLVKLDLSCNAIVELPANFGLLKRLRHLDLYNNKLTHLPVSFDQLVSLRWLDLKKNPLSEQLERAAGSCLNQRECEQCARSVVAFMARVRVRVDEERTRQEQLAQDARNAQLASEEMDKERLRQEKKAKKEKKKQDYRDCKREERVVSDVRDAGDNDVFTKRGSDVSANRRQDSRRTSAEVGRSCMFWVNMLLLLVAVVLAGSVLYVHSSGTDSSSSIEPVLQRMSGNLRTLRQIVEVRGVEWLGRGSAGLMWCTRLGGQLGDQLVEAAVQLYDWVSLQLATARRSTVGRQLVAWLVRLLELGPLAVTHAGRLALQLFELHAPSLQLLVQQLTTGTQAVWSLVRAETPRYLQLAGQKVQQLAASLTG